MTCIVLATLLLLGFLEVEDFLLFCFLAGLEETLTSLTSSCMDRIWRSILPEIMSASPLPVLGDPTALVMGVQSSEDSSSKTSGNSSSSERKELAGMGSERPDREDRRGHDGYAQYGEPGADPVDAAACSRDRELVLSLLVGMEICML